MKLYISHTLGRQDEHLLTILAFRLRDEGFGISDTTQPLSAHKRKHLLSLDAQASIVSSDMLIGIVTKTGNPADLLYKEWDLAIQEQIPCGLLVETGAVVDKKYQAYAVPFNRLDLSKTSTLLEEKRRYYLSEYEPLESRALNKAQRIAWSAVYDVLLTILPVFDSKVSV
jgi:hypothetical protein